MSIEPSNDREREAYRKAAPLDAGEEQHYETRAKCYETALKKIRHQAGKVCDEYETCTHRACQASYAAWAIADQALKECD